MVAAVGSAQPFEDEYRIVRPDGEERWIYLRAEPSLGSAGVVVGLRGIGQDVTDGRVIPADQVLHPLDQILRRDRRQAGRRAGPFDERGELAEGVGGVGTQAPHEVVELLGLTDGVDGIDDVVEVVAAGLGPEDVPRREGQEDAHQPSIPASTGSASTCSCTRTSG